MFNRLFNAVKKAVTVFPVGFLGTLLPLIFPFLEKSLPEPLTEITTWEQVGLSALIGAATALVAGVKRFLLYKASLERP